MARGLAAFFRRADEIRVPAPCRAEIRATELTEAGERVERADRAVGTLRDEYRVMARKYNLLIVGFGLLHIGRTDSLAESEMLEIRAWYRDWLGRMDSALKEFNDSLSVWAGLKGAN